MSRTPAGKNRNYRCQTALSQADQLQRPTDRVARYRAATGRRQATGMARRDQFADSRAAIAIAAVATIGGNRIPDAPDHRFASLLSPGTAIAIPMRHISNPIHHRQLWIRDHRNGIIRL